MVAKDGMYMFEDKNSKEYIDFSNNFREHRFFQWSSLWYQAKEPICRPDVHSVLEFGGGRNVTKALIEHFGIRHVDVDFNDKRYSPDIVSTIADFETDERFDMVCCFQALEHNPVEELPVYLKKFKTLSKRYVYISVPYSERWISIILNFNVKKWLSFDKVRLFTFGKTKKRNPDIAAYKKLENKHSPHWWEVGDKNFSKKDMRRVISESGLRILNEHHNPMFPYHLFYLLEIDA